MPLQRMLLKIYVFGFLLLNLNESALAKTFDDLVLMGQNRVNVRVLAQKFDLPLKSVQVAPIVVPKPAGQLVGQAVAQPLTLVRHDAPKLEAPVVLNAPKPKAPVRTAPSRPVAPVVAQPALAHSSTLEKMSFFTPPSAWVHDVTIDGVKYQNATNHLGIIGADNLQKIAQGQGSKVIVIDDGIQDHHALKNNLKQPVLANASSDKWSHGTAVSSIVVSVAPQVQLDFLSSSFADFQQSLDQAAQRAGDVVNLSVGINDFDDCYNNPSIKDEMVCALEAIVQSGKAVIIAFGNEWDDSDLQFPKNFGKKYSDSLVALVKKSSLLNRVRLVSNVSCKTGDASLHPTSNRTRCKSPYVISAPGTDILVAQYNQYVIWPYGTSASAPIVAGAIALLKSAIEKDFHESYPKAQLPFTIDHYLSWIDRSARTINHNGQKLNHTYGVGILD